MLQGPLGRWCHGGKGVKAWVISSAGSSSHPYAAALGSSALQQDTSFNLQTFQTSTNFCPNLVGTCWARGGGRGGRTCPGAPGPPIRSSPPAGAGAGAGAGEGATVQIVRIYLTCSSLGLSCHCFSRKWLTTCRCRFRTRSRCRSGCRFQCRFRTRSRQGQAVLLILQTSTSLKKKRAKNWHF